MAALIAAQREDHRIPHAASCRTLGVSPSWFYKWRGGTPGPRAQRRDRLKAEVARLFALHEGKYGSPRITADLRDAGWRVSENNVAKLMAGQHLAARRKKRRKATTRPGRGRWRAPDPVKRDFLAAALSRKRFGDGTQIVTDEGRLHLVSVLDVASRRVLGFRPGRAARCGAGLRRAGHGDRGPRRPGARRGVPHRPGQREPRFKGSSQHCFAGPSVGTRRGPLLGVFQPRVLRGGC